ncbi:hypothetical protein ABPG72_008464 [Tetrahymena utriculariae]
MAFVTERVDDNLYNLMKKGDYKAICQSELELKLQIENILKVLQFLHNDVKTAHLGIAPENIFIVNGQWKIAGFTFSTPVQNQIATDVQNADFTKRPFDHFAQFYPNLSFSAPEVAEIPPKCTFSSDIFSLSLLILLMYQIKYMQTTNVTPMLFSKTVGEYSSQLGQIQNHFKSQNYIQRDMNEDFKKLISRMLAKNPSTRPTIEQIKESSWMNDPFVKAIYMLENIVELEQNKQISFLAGMSNILFKYEKPVIKKRIVPQLIDLSKFEYLIPPILNIVTDCIKQPDLYSTSEFQSDLQPFVVGLTKRKSIPGKALYALVVNCEHYFKVFDKAEFQNVYLVPVLKCFDIPQLQGYVLTQCDFLMSKLDYQFTKSKLLPRILLLCTSNVPKIMKQSIFTLKKITPSLDKHILNDQVLTTLDKLRKMTISDKSITMLILDIYIQISKSLDILVIAQKILPSLIPYLIDQSLGRKEFDAYLNAVNVMIKQIEAERKKQIKDIEGGDEESAPAQNANNNNNNNDDDFFQFEQKPNPDQKNSQSKEFDFLSIFDQPKQPSAPAAGNGQNQNNQNVNTNNQQQQQPQKPSGQMDFNFDMFDNIPSVQQNQSSQGPSDQINNNSNNINNNFNQNSLSANPVINNENNDFFNSIKPVNNNNNNINNNNNNNTFKDPFASKIEYKDPFASQKLSKNIDNKFNEFQPKPQNQQIDLFANMQKKDQNYQKQQLDVNDLFSGANNNYNQNQNNANNKNTNDLFGNSYNNYNSNNQVVSVQNQQYQSTNLYTPAQSGWGADDPFSEITGQTSNTFANQNQNNLGNQQQQQNSQKGFSTFEFTGNLVDINTAFGSLQQQNNNQVQSNQQQGSLFNNLKKNNKNNMGQKNPLDDLFGPSPVNNNQNQPNNNYNSNNNNNNNFDLF